MSRKNVVEIAKGLQCGLFATQPTIQDAFKYVLLLNNEVATIAVQVVANSIAKQLLNEVEIAPTVNERQEVMIQLMDLLEEEFNHYEEGLTTDLECIRKMYFEVDHAYAMLSKCTGCGCADDGNHFETHGGNLCTACNPDQRVFTVSYGRGFPIQPPVLKYAHQMIRFEGMDMDDEDRMNGLNPGEMSDVYLDNDRRFHIMRTR